MLRAKHLCLVAMFSALGARCSVKAAPQPAQQVTPPTAQEILLTVDPAESAVDWTLKSTLHTVHGTFALKRGTLRLDPASGQASGEIVADATSGASGNEGRDKKMHKEILESARYSEIVFRPERLEGKIQQGNFTAQLVGIFVLHGSQHELALPVEAELAGRHWTGAAQFTVPYIEWGLKNPSNFFLKADKHVEVTVQLKGEVSAPQP